LAFAPVRSAKSWSASSKNTAYKKEHEPHRLALFFSSFPHCCTPLLGFPVDKIHLLCYNMYIPCNQERGGAIMKNTVRAYLPCGGAAARRTAMRLFFFYGIRPHLIARAVSLPDRLWPFWRVDALSAQLPDDMLVAALTDAARATKDDRLIVLYLCDPTFLLPYHAALERCFILRRADGRPLGESLRGEEGV
jgi:hypothetical protein